VAAGVRSRRAGPRLTRRRLAGGRPGRDPGGRAMNDQQLDISEHIAVVGMAGRFPGAANVDEYWANLAAGVESLTTFPADHPVDHVPTAGVVEDADRFDAAFFGCS